MIKEWIDSYNPRNVGETEQALREIMQEIALAGLYRGNFFKMAAFYGGTALRICHGLNRFSEDLDFSLLEKNETFELTPYLETIREEFAALGMNVSINLKTKQQKSTIDSAFLKSETIWGELIFENTIPQIKLSIKPTIKIKIEIDTKPPLNFATENQLIIKPYSFYVNCFTLPNLFAGKLHALLFRKWKSRVKGRDWFDFEWYIKKGVPLDIAHFCQRAQESGDWANQEMEQHEILELIEKKINFADIEKIKDDVIRFIPNPEILNIWSIDYFQLLKSRMQFQ